MILSRVLQLCVVLVTFQAVPMFAAPPRIQMCHLPGLEDQVECVRLAVPLDWQRPSGQALEIFAARLPSLSKASTADAFVMIPGGPGQSGDSLIGLATGKLKAIRQKRDIILIYPRGTARSAPLKCDSLNAEKLFDAAKMKAAAQRCAATAKYNPSFFTSAEIVQDIDALRAALGYKQISLWGGSFGSRIAQHYARDYPSATRLVVLDSVAPVGASILQTTPRAAQRALDNISQSCARDKKCAASIGNVSTASRQLINKLTNNPAKINIIDPYSGRPTTEIIDGRTMASALHLALYDPNSRAMVPQLVSMAQSGNFQPILAFSALASNALEDSVAIGANFSALCAEDYRITSRAQTQSAARTSFLNLGPAEALFDICPVWHQKIINAKFTKPFKSNVPALLLSGALDPITPPESGAIAAGYFVGALHIVVPASGHISSAFGCAARNVVHFVETAQHIPKEWQCVQSPMPPAALASPNG